MILTLDTIESRTERWDAISFVISSNYRILVLDQLANGPEIPSRIDTGARALREQGPVELLVPEEQEKRRLYGLTERGERVWYRIQTAGLLN